MKLIYTILLASTLILTSCVGDITDGTDHPIEIVHPAPSDPNLDEAIIDTNNTNRNNWQKPRKVIEMLGDLRGKVIADIGAGTGYFSFQLLTNAGKVIAIDIDTTALAQIDAFAKSRPEAMQAKLETRLVGFDSPNLKNEEVDIVFFSNTYSYIENKVDYLKTVFKGVKLGGRVYIVDYKMKRLPKIFLSREERVALFEVEKHLEEAGFTHIFSDDQTLAYQYIVIAEKKEIVDQ